MNKAPLLHPSSKKLIQSFTTTPSHALLLVGQLGAGKQFMAEHIASEILGSPVRTAPYALIVTPEKLSITIAQIREVQNFLQLKTTGRGDIRRVILIVDADTMTTEAQNALLKSLEEPPADTVIILTAQQTDSLQPTIRSRTQAIRLHNPTLEQAREYFAQHPAPSVEHAYRLSNGALGLMSAILDDAKNHVLAAQIEVAKGLYGKTTYERLLEVEALSKQKDELGNLLYACKRICIAGLEQAATRGQQPAMKRWHSQLQLVLESERALTMNANTKLLLTNLFVQM